MTDNKDAQDTTQEDHHSKRDAETQTVLGIFIAIQFLDSIISTGAKKFPIQYSSEWLITQLQSGDKIACNEGRFRYYAQQQCVLPEQRFYSNYSEADVQFLKQNHFNYLLLWVKHKNTAMLNKLQQDNSLELLKSFKNKKDDMALVFRIKNN